MDITIILIGLILSVIVTIISSTTRVQCLTKTSNFTHEQIKDLPESFYIENVPFYDYDMVDVKCMPASLGMVMRFYDNKTVPDMLHQKFPELGYSLENFKQYAEKEGFIVEVYESNVDDLKLKISEGRPVIVSQWYDPYHRWGKWGHARVVIGYTKQDGVDHFIVYDPIPELGKDYKISFEEFKELWNREPKVCNRAFLVYK